MYVYKDRTNGSMDECMERWIDVCFDGWVGVGMNGRMVSISETIPAWARLD
jgi:hypothetical protein